MNDPKSILRRGWVTAGNSELWNCPGTYCTVPYEFLPRVDQPPDDLGWLDDVSPELRRVIASTCTLNSGENDVANLERVVAKARTVGLNLPQPFLRFMRNFSLQDKVPTGTACFLALSKDYIPVVEADGHFLLRFLNDSQSCVMWYLCVGREGEASVVASYYFFEPDLFDAMEYECVKRENLIHEAILCADTFTEFLYRFWVENTIWYSLQERLPLAPCQQDYRSQITNTL